ncbi:unnamed protein product [Porites lobata]|uniref:Uncharacterized protein n=1 Tax=Porites lobata TaxID=104759 RepID=A0ABN8RFM3_9CNID|nr:unnamed protein product [Porites lobata]
MASVTMQISSLIDSRFDNFKKQFTEENSSSVEAAVKRAKRARFVFQSKGNEQQFEHAESVLDKLESAKGALNANAISKAKTAIEEGIALVTKRMKVIKIADKSQYSWATVQEYLSDELASDSEDEKRLFRSERRAEKKVKDSKKKRSQNSTYRELKAVFYVLKSYAVSLQHQRVKVFVDNMGASRILMVGSSKLHLQQIAVDIFSICLSFDISLDSQWLPREENARADLLSRFIDRDDWSLNPVVFQSLDARWGPHSVDRFSSYFNSQVVRFNSKYFSPGCAAVDALAQDWSSDNNWLCPPTHLIVAAVKHLRYHKGVGTIIIPEWPSASFWPFLHISPSRFHTFVKEFVVLPRLADLLIEGPGQREVYRKKPSVFVGCPSFNMLALRLDFR